MKKTKTFDCVEMKDRIQAELQQSLQGLSPAEARAAIRDRLQQSSSPVARIWRRIHHESATAGKRPVASS